MTNSDKISLVEDHLVAVNVVYDLCQSSIDEKP